MAKSSAGRDRKRRKDQRWLCSHLVRLVFEDDQYPPETVLLEDIGAEGAGLGVESAYPTGLRLKVRAEGFEAPATIINCQPRETDFRLSLRFVNGFRWHPTIWEPEHLFLPPRRSAKAKGAASR